MTQSVQAPLAQTPPGPTIHTKAIFFASFMTLIAGGIGFGVRGGILGDWGAQFGFTKTDLGAITGAGLSGFGFTIIFFSFFADIVGYRALLIGAFSLQMLSAAVMVAASFTGSQQAAYWCLYIGCFIFSLGNGLCEAAINPLTATLFPKQKTHYLNILHAGWPGGLVIGGLLGYCFAGKGAAVWHVRWEFLAAAYVIPALYYGFVVLKNKFPVSEAKAAGVGLGRMLTTLVAPLLLFIFLIHAMVGYTELGTDSWIQDIMRNTIGKNAMLLFVYTSTFMFILRFFAGPIVHKINPLGLLTLSACFGATGLFLLGKVNGLAMVFIVATIFAIGKTFYWPTMLGVIGERFPQGGALAMGISGGIGMLAAGFLAGPGIGYTQDYNASKNLQQIAPDAYTRVKADTENKFLFLQPITGLNGAKVEVVRDDPPGKTLAEDTEKLAKAGKTDKEMGKLNEWWNTVEKPHADADHKTVNEATIHGGRMALCVTAGVPATMAVCYLLLVLYFAMRGGYKAVHLDAQGHQVEVDDLHAKA